jgi:uncharacterized protein
MGIIDANVIVRYKTNDHPDMAQRSRAFIEKVNQGLEVYLSEAVISEAVYVLTSKSLYHLSREEVKSYLTHIINLRGVVVSNKAIVLRALGLFSTTKLDFVDVLLAAYVEAGKFEHIITFDEKITKATGIKTDLLVQQ